MATIDVSVSSVTGKEKSERTSTRVVVILVFSNEKFVSASAFHVNFVPFNNSVRRAAIVA